MRVLAIEPYYGGSHRAFLDGWIDRSRHDWELLTLPANKWKWRMRHGAMTFAEAIRAGAGDGCELLFASDMLDLAQLVGLVPDALGPLPKVVYFHENQLTYPVQVERERDLHFGLTNLSTALAADAVWFNSAFHRDDFLDALGLLIGRMPYRGRELRAPYAERIRAKASVRSPPFDLPAAEAGAIEGPLRIVWAARWEFDKNPDLFFEALFELADREVDFRVDVLGESFARVPPIFERARARLGERIGRWGYVPTRREYAEALAEADVFVSTADHEFFGLSAVEAIAAGARPLLPDRLAYPELLAEAAEPGRYLYDGSRLSLVAALEALAPQVERLRGRSDADLEALRRSLDRYRWELAAGRLDEALERVAAGRADRPSVPASISPGA